MGANEPTTGAALVAECLRLGRVRFPDVQTSDAELAPRIMSHLEGCSGLDDICAEELFLAAACAQNDREALRAFEESYGPEIDAAARSLRGDANFSSELRQRLFDHIFVGTPSEPPRIATYSGRGPLAAWVRVAAKRAGLTLKRGEKRRGLASTDDDWSAALCLPSAGSPELDLIKAQYAREFGDALRRACNELGARERRVLRMHFAEGLNVDRIGDAYGVHRATAARWVSRAKDELMARTRAVLQSQLNVSASEWESVVRLIESQITISMSDLLPRSES